MTRTQLEVKLHADHGYDMEYLVRMATRYDYCLRQESQGNLREVDAARAAVKRALETSDTSCYRGCLLYYWMDHCAYFPPEVSGRALVLHMIDCCEGRHGTLSLGVWEKVRREAAGVLRCSAAFRFMTALALKKTAVRKMAEKSREP